MTQTDTAISETAFRIHLDGETLTERNAVAVELRAVGSQHFTVAVGIVHVDAVAVYIEAYIHNCTTVGQDVVVV